MCGRQSNLSLVPCPVVTAHSGIVTGVRYTHDGLFVVSCGSDDRVKLWDGTTGRNTMVCVWPKACHTRCNFVACNSVA